MKRALEALKPSLHRPQKRRDKRLHEEVIECRRSRGGDGNKKSREKGSRKAAQKDEKREDYPEHESIRHMAKHNNRTWPADNLEPLKRWLCTQLGRPWSEVYAELGNIARPDSMHGAHIREHLWDFVYKSTRLDAENSIVVADKWGAEVYPFKKERKMWVKDRYFVHPVSGTLQKMSDLTAPKTNQKCPLKARFKREKEKYRWKIRQGIDLGKKEMPGLDLSNFAQIRTRNKRIATGMLLDIRCRENIFRATVEQVIQREGHVGRIVDGRSQWAFGQITTIHCKVTECCAGSAFEVGKSYRLEVFNEEKTDWTIFDACRLF